MNAADYRRKLCEAALARCEGPVTSGDLLDTMSGLAAAEDHPPQLWRNITKQQVAGILRTLEEDNLAAKGEPRKSRVRGREDPTWCRTPETDAALPATDELPGPACHERVAPGASRAAVMPFSQMLGAAAGNVGGDPNGASLTRSQVNVLLRFNEQLCAATARHMQEVSQLTGRVREELLQAGVDVQ